MTIIISKEEYKRRDRIYHKKSYDSEKAKKNYQEQLKAQGKLTEKERIFQLREKIKSLKLEGLKNKEIALMLKLPIKTLERHITYMKKNGLL